jgi:hypothetical protein
MHNGAKTSPAVNEVAYLVRPWLFASCVASYLWSNATTNLQSTTSWSTSTVSLWSAGGDGNGRYNWTKQFLWVENTQIWPSSWWSVESETENMVVNPEGPGPGNDCAAEDQQQLKMTDPSSQYVWRPISNGKLTVTEVWFWAQDTHKQKWRIVSRS